MKSFWRRSLHPAWKSQHSPRLMALMSWLVRAFFWKNFLLLSILQRRTGNMIYLSTVGTCRIRTHPNPSFLPLPTAQISQSTDPVLPELIPPCLSEWRICVKWSAGKLVFLLWQAGCETALQILGFPDNYMALFPRYSVHSAHTAIAQLWRTSSYIALCFQELLSPLLRQYKRLRPRDRHRT